MVSTPIRDVVNPYGHLNLVSIARGWPGFVAAIEALLDVSDRGPWLSEVDAFLKTNSWDNTCAGMATAMRTARPTPQHLTIRANGVANV